MYANSHEKFRCTAARSSAGAMAGFTLIEALIVVTLLAVLTTMAAPSFNNLIRSEAIKSASFDVFSSLILARSEAITRNATVSITPTLGGTNWAGGWEVKDTASGTVIRKQNAVTNNVTIAGPASVSYNGTGRLSAALAAPFALASAGVASSARCITVDLSGRPLVKKEACP